MSEWTNAARAKLEEYMAQTRRTLEASGADASEVMDDLRRHVLRSIANRIDNDSATHRTVRARRARFIRSRHFQRAELCKRRLQIEPERRRGCTANRPYF